jgi:XTP/dITP diphosphohydrolase
VSGGSGRRGAPPQPHPSRLLVASFNPGKARELAGLAGGLGLEIVSLRDVGIDEPYEETGSTYEENALGKARHYARLARLVTVADDSGIEVDALDGAPGIRSARHGGEELDDLGRCRRLLDDLRGVPEERRRARYVAVAVVARPDGAARTFTGTCEGRITGAMRGRRGFGYDPLFFFPPFDATFAEVPVERKNRVSHRGHAFAALAEFLGSEEGSRFLTATS